MSCFENEGKYKTIENLKWRQKLGAKLSTCCKDISNHILEYFLFDRITFLSEDNVNTTF